MSLFLPSSASSHLVLRPLAHRRHAEPAAIRWARPITLYKAHTVVLPRHQIKTQDPHPGPSDAYLAASLNPSSPTQSLRKLLVLDLNGCLVHRDNAKRACYRRPDMDRFRKYLFHPSTRSWLDVMVWSAAQPHNVASMVDVCFGPDKKYLLDVWARDRMQLRSEDYHRKAEVYKDMNSIWSHIPFTEPHSQHTTILLDDSKKKAAYQPYNHVLVEEYVHPPPVDVPRATISSSAANDNSPSSIPEISDVLPSQDSDGTLLSVIGILDAVRPERNVSYWIRAGGLLQNTTPLGEAVPEMWFRNPDAVRFWEARGTQALRDLDTPPIPGPTV